MNIQNFILKIIDITHFALYNSFNAFKFSLDVQIMSYLTGTRIFNPHLVSFDNSFSLKC